MGKSDKGKGIWSSLRGVFTSDRLKEPAAAAPAVMTGEEDHWVEMNLDQMLAAEPDLPVHVVSLKEYRKALGDHWGKLGPKVMVLGESVIRRVARNGGIPFQKEDCFIILYKHAFRPKGAVYTAEAAAELGKRLVGAKFSMGGAGAGPAVGVAEVKGGDILGADGTVAIDKLSAIAEASTLLALPNPDPTMVSTGGSGATPTLSSTNRAAKDIRTAEWQPLEKKSVPSAAPTLVPLEPRPKKKPDPVWVPIGKDK